MGLISKWAVAGAMSLAAVTISSPASSMMWDIVEVQTGSSGFGASSFHDASDDTPMTGNTLSTITGESAPNYISPLGTFDDVSGIFHAVLNFTVGGGSSTFSLDSTTTTVQMDFGGDGSFGPLLSAANLLLNLGTGNGLVTGNGYIETALIGFKAGFVCCGGTDNDPNTFQDSGNEAILTLWGADGFNFGTSTYPGSNLGMDIRLRMVLSENQNTGEVPVPPALPLFGTGLALMGILGWRRKRKAAA